METDPLVTGTGATQAGSTGSTQTTSSSSSSDEDMSIFENYEEIYESSDWEEIEPEKLAYILSDSWGDISVKYDNEWSLTSSYNKYRITLIGNTLEELFEHYNSIVREVSGKILDSYPNY